GRARRRSSISIATTWRRTPGGFPRDANAVRGDRAGTQSLAATPRRLIRPTRPSAARRLQGRAKTKPARSEPHQQSSAEQDERRRDDDGQKRLIEGAMRV